MSEPRTDALERALRASRAVARRAPGATSPGSPSLAGRQAESARAASLLGSRMAEADPLTGHRGPADGALVAARCGELVVACSLGLEADGPCLRGQVIGPQAMLAGAMVHVRTDAGTVLAAVDETGEFVAPRLPGPRVGRLDLETEEATWSLGWPAAGGDPT